MALLGLAAVLLAALPVPASPSAPSPTYAETRVWAFNLEIAAGVGAERGSSQTGTEAYGLRYDEPAAGYPLVPRATTGAESANAQAALARKLRTLEGAQQSAARVRTLPDGRVRYYGAERAAERQGPTRGAALVTEYNPTTGQVRQWYESYDAAGNVVRVHPKSIDGQVLDAQHFPPTGAEVPQ